MTEERTVLVDGTQYGIVLSDERETLLAARAAGRVPVGLWKEQVDLSMVRYLVEDVEAADEAFLERVVRREMGLPWRIAESERLLLREFEADDWQYILPEAQDTDQDRIFCGKETLSAYIQNQYGFYEYGVWAVVRRSDGVILGTAGIVGAEDREDTGLWLELGYHVFEPYRRCGYAMEACRMILDHAQEEYEAHVYARTKWSNLASRKLLEKLGFVEEWEDEAEMVRYVLGDSRN